MVIFLVVLVFQKKKGWDLPKNFSGRTQVVKLYFEKWCDVDLSLTIGK